MNVILMGKHNVSVSCLEEILKFGDNVIVVMHPDEFLGPVPWQMSLEGAAAKHNLQTYFPENVNAPEFLDIAKEFEPDIILSLQFKQILKKELLEIPRLGSLNLHFSLLPKYGGVYPGNWAILNREEKAGVTLHFMDEGVDTGDLIAQKEVLIDNDETARSLYDKSTLVGVTLFKEMYPSIREGKIPRISQDRSKATYYGIKSIDFEKDSKVDWSATTKKVYTKIRAFTFPPYQYPRTFYKGKKLEIIESSPVLLKDGGKEEYGSGQIVSTSDDILTVKTGDGAVGIRKIKIENGTEIPSKNFILENDVREGERLE